VGQSNEIFSDFREHVTAVPQVAPAFDNVTFDGPGLNEDFGLEQVTGNPADRYAFRTSPLRNVALQRAVMHNGAFAKCVEVAGSCRFVASDARATIWYVAAQ
jgi:cytochrome c peroxidase